MGRTSDARERLIETATRLIHESGYNAVGVNELCASAGVKKGSFYHYFESKGALVEAVVEAQLEHYRALAQDRQEASPVERLAAFANAVRAMYLAASPDNPHVLGCPIGNLAAEMSTQDERIRRAVVRCYRELQEMIAGFLDEAVAAGQIPPCDTSEKAMELLMIMQGGALLSKAMDDAGMTEKLLTAVPRLLGVIPPA